MSGNPDKFRGPLGGQSQAYAGALFDRRQTLPDGELDELKNVSDVKLLHDARPVGFHRLRRKGERLCDDDAGLPLDQ